MARKPSRWRYVLYGLGGLAVVVSAAFGLLTVQESRFGWERRFDAAVWRAHSEDPPVRLAMVRSLLRSPGLVGKNRSEIVALLGPPSAVDRKYIDSDMVYWLGPERGWLRLDHEWLRIDLDEHDVVVKAEVLGD